ncbi:MAG: epoxyqueuosine reductase QueH [Deltaproteobacteria bacterium]|nr:epoxyqueuosine reductase QueH [Deltaproteobacteria bacterium]
MRVLLHICCGPCAIMPVRALREDGHTVAGWFHNPNIHPLSEYLRRRQGAAQVADIHGIPLYFPENGPDNAGKNEYDLVSWCRAALGYEGGRCLYCRESRFDAAAKAARDLGFDAFTSSLLYSRHQDHEGMRQAGEKAAAAWNVPFLYRDFRPFWQEGIKASKELGIYRQQYCGCAFSEEERYAGELAKAARGLSR